MFVILVTAHVLLNRIGFIYDWTNGRLGDPKPVKVEKARDIASTTSGTAAKSVELVK